MAAMKQWTLDDLDRLPDDGNKYELVEGRLFVTPAPSHDDTTSADAVIWTPAGAAR